MCETQSDPKREWEQARFILMSVAGLMLLACRTLLWPESSRLLTHWWPAWLHSLGAPLLNAAVLILVVWFFERLLRKTPLVEDVSRLASWKVAVAFTYIVVAGVTIVLSGSFLTLLIVSGVFAIEYGIPFGKEVAAHAIRNGEQEEEDPEWMDGVNGCCEVALTAVVSAALAALVLALLTNTLLGAVLAAIPICIFNGILLCLVVGVTCSCDIAAYKKRYPVPSFD